MRTDIEAQPDRPPILKRALAGVVLIAALALALKLVIGLVMTVFYVVVIAAIVVAVLWALKTLVW